MKSNIQTIFGIHRRSILSFGIFSRIEGNKAIYTKLFDFHPFCFIIDQDKFKWYFSKSEICSYKDGMRIIFNNTKFKI